MKDARSRPHGSSTRALATAFGVVVALTTSGLGAADVKLDGGSVDLPRPGSVTWNGVGGGKQVKAATDMSGLQGMLWKYVARCALPAGRELVAPATGTGPQARFPGTFGLAPEWLEGSCDDACKQKVSSCLIALTNRTGKHVLLSIGSGDPAMGKALLPNESDLGFPHQEGVFFGNVFANEAYACQGRDVEKGAQVKRFCASEPATCSGLALFADAGRCEDVCEMTCASLSDGSQRCVAVSCRDPGGKTWSHPMTTHLRNKMEAVNTDAAKGVLVHSDFIDSLDDGDSITFKRVDFGTIDHPLTTFVAGLASARARGQIEVWLRGRGRIGVLDIEAKDGVREEQTASIEEARITGQHDVTLRFTGGSNLGRLSHIELR